MTDTKKDDTQTPTARLAMVTLDCADPQAESAFWSELFGWETTYADESYGMLKGPDHALGFGKVEGYEPPPGRTPAAASSSTSTSPSTTFPPPRSGRSSSVPPCPTSSQVRPGGRRSTRPAIRSA